MSLASSKPRLPVHGFPFLTLQDVFDDALSEFAFRGRQTRAAGHTGHLFRGRCDREAVHVPTGCFGARRANVTGWEHESPVSRVWQNPSKVATLASTRSASGGCRFESGERNLYAYVDFPPYF
jgi:hypothetical protein